MSYLNTQYANIGYNYPNYVSGQSFRGKNNNGGQNSPGFGGILTESETKALTDCYISSPSESLLGAAWGGVTFSLLNNPRFVVHPFNTFKSFRNVDPMFKDVLKEGSELNKLWVNPETNGAMRDAYCEMHRAFARSEWKIGLFRKRYSKENIDQLKDIMEKALKEAQGKSPEEARKIITRATKTLESAYVSNGPLGFLGRLFAGFTGGSKSKTIAEGIANTNFINENVNKELLTEDIIKKEKDLLHTDLLKKYTDKAALNSATSLKQALKKHASLSSIVGWAAFEFFFSMGDLKKAFEKDRENKENGNKSNYAIKQVGQTVVKGMGAGLGWGVGEALGNWAFAKKGLKLGAKLHPAIGTVTGGIIGLATASIGMMITGRLTKKIVGENVGAKLQAQELTQTPDGQAQLLEGVYQKVQKGEASPEAKAAFQKLLVQLQAQQA